MPSENPTFSSTNPQFFKIILAETLKENKLRVPQCFVKKCGETLTESVFLKLPCGSKWKMKLESDNGKFWLQKGWPEFVKHYSIGRGHMLTFRYDGNSEIYVVIFNTNTVEIDYPATPVHFGMPNIDVKLRVPKREVIDDSIEILDEIGVKSSCSQPSKRMKAYPPGKLDSPSKSTDNSDTKTAKKINYGIPKTMKTLDKSERIAALQRTVGFKSEHPYFKMVMQPYYILGKNMTFPHLFAKIHLNNRSYDVTLKVPNENKTWPVKYTYREHKSAAPRFQGGWTTFVQENNLKVGDVCVFVLLKAINIVSFEVVIFRAGESLKGSVGTIHNEAGTRCLLNSSKKQEIGKQLPLTLDERVKILEKDAIEHEKPFFKIVIQPSNKWHVRVPLDIAEKHIKNDGGIVLANPNGEQWPAQFKRRKSPVTGKSAAVIFDGWKEFMTNNNLKVGDICMFELLDKTELVFQVLIVRVSDFLKQQRYQAISSPEGENKPKGDERVKIETDS
ncbi:B3 domain-containing transcription factor VRN1-like [Humulus lupulus]|uniref:B3 domain-containing transcription factor VRN1-like n=1 Tax=Humulus lupulus TaxID=3486 RepID=UPI002B40AE35|nr:B3 domain-containing transcription factor VRN1-like [Humulus lupulus]XP_062102215.1 B3 domain-containing transcription factor VRN1-like [Humulus lupulus]